MEGAYTILLNEEALGRVANDKKTLFVLEWLSYLNKTLVKVDKVCTWNVMTILTWHEIKCILLVRSLLTIYFVFFSSVRNERISE